MAKENRESVGGMQQSRDIGPQSAHHPAIRRGRQRWQAPQRVLPRTAALQLGCNGCTLVRNIIEVKRERVRPAQRGLSHAASVGGGQVLSSCEYQYSAPVSLVRRNFFAFFYPCMAYLWIWRVRRLELVLTWLGRLEIDLSIKSLRWMQPNKHDHYKRLHFSLAAPLLLLLLLLFLYR